MQAADDNNLLAIALRRWSDAGAIVRRAAFCGGTLARVLTLTLVLGGVISPVAVATPFFRTDPDLKKTPPEMIAQKVGIDQKLDAQVPLDVPLVNEAGESITLASLAGKRPIVLSLVYYECPSLCTMSLNGMTKAFKPLQLTMGRDYEVVSISFDPRETAELASDKKSAYVKALGKVEAEQGWHFLTAPQESIDRICQSVGFRYTWDEASQQFAHTTALIILTPDGKVSKYLYGLDYWPRDLRLALVEASEGRIGTISDALNLLCFQYDPSTGRYGFYVIRFLQLGAVLTVGLLGTFAFVMIRRERRRRDEANPGA